MVEKRGLAFDRLWAVFDKDCQALTAREYPALLDIEAKVAQQELLICYQGKTVDRIPIDLPDEESAPVKIFNYQSRAVPTKSSVNEWFSDYLGIECQVLFHHEAIQRNVLQEHGGAEGETVGFADQCPILLTTEASLAILNERME